jgi:hypothetical protein
VVWALGFAWAARIRLPVWIPIALGLATWAIYVGDRLLDAQRGLQPLRRHRLRERHRFHWRYRRVLFPLAVAAAAGAACVIAELMPRAAIERNFVLGSVTLAYFTKVHSPVVLKPRARWSVKFFPGELLIALLFTAGCVLPVYSRLPGTWKEALPTPGGAALFFVLVVWLNAYAIGCWESRGRDSRVFASGCLLGLLGLAMASVVPASEARTGALIAMGSVSALLLALLDRFRERLTPLALRACADLVLLTPLAVLVR